MRKYLATVRAYNDFLAEDYCSADPDRLIGLGAILVGAAVAAYHTLLVWGLVPKDLVPCGQGPSCAEVKFQLLGFVTLPLLSLTAFALIVILLWILKSRKSE